MKKCPKHGCKMVLVEFGVGWGSESRLECPECKKEEKFENNRSGKAVFSTGSASWGSK